MVYGRKQIAAINIACGRDVPIMNRRFTPRRCPDIIIRRECMFILYGNLGHHLFNAAGDIALDLFFDYILKHQKSAPPDQPEPDNHLNTAAVPSIGQMKEGTSRS